MLFALQFWDAINVLSPELLYLKSFLSSCNNMGFMRFEWANLTSAFLL